MLADIFETKITIDDYAKIDAGEELNRLNIALNDLQSTQTLLLIEHRLKLEKRILDIWEKSKFKPAYEILFGEKLPEFSFSYYFDGKIENEEQFSQLVKNIIDEKRRDISKYKLGFSQVSVDLSVSNFKIFLPLQENNTEFIYLELDEMLEVSESDVAELKTLKSEIDTLQSEKNKDWVTEKKKVIFQKILGEHGIDSLSLGQNPTKQIDGL